MQNRTVNFKYNYFDLDLEVTADFQMFGTNPECDDNWDLYDLEISPAIEMDRLGFIAQDTISLENKFITLKEDISAKACEEFNSQ